MKTFKYLLIALSFISTAGYAQKNIIKTNPIGDILKVYNIGYERQLKNSNSIVFTYYNFEIGNFNGNNFSGEYRFYLNEDKPALKGWFVGPSLFYFDVEEKSKTRYKEYNEFGALFNLGYQWSLFKNISMDSYFGFGFVSTDELLNTNLAGILSINIGYQW